MPNNRIKSGVFRRTFIIYAIFMVPAALLVELYIARTVKEANIETLRENLVVQAQLISDRIPFQSQSRLDLFCAQLKQKTGSRVTLIDVHGKVTGDSDGASAKMDNHANREEIRDASAGRAGMAIRFSDTLKHDFLYVAIKVTRGKEAAGFIRLSVPLKEVDRSINQLRFGIIIAVTLVLLAAVVVSVWQMNRIRRLTEQIRVFSLSLAGGEHGKKMHLENAGEFDEIAESLNTMSDKLRNSSAAHEEEKRRLNIILRNIPDALFIVDAQGIIVLSSLAARKAFIDAPFQGKSYIEVVRNAEFLSLMDRVRSENKPALAEVDIDFPSERFYVVQASPLFYEEVTPSGFVIVFHDITELKKLEQTRKDFVANISHEIKTPITAINGFAETLLEGALDDREHAIKFLGTIKANSVRINNLIDDLMTISKIELGVIKVVKTGVQIREAADHVVTLLRDKAAEKKLFIKNDLQQPLTVEADRDRLIQILTNLVDNGIKFTETGGVIVGAGRENEVSYLFVEDTGIGIAPKHLPRIGERFYRVDPGRSRSMGGTGLGLAIVKHLVKAHGWDMKIESTPGKGTKVKILLT